MSLEYRSEDITVHVHAPISSAVESILSPDSLRFLGFLCSKFEDRRRFLLSQREQRSAEYDSGHVPHFLPPSIATTSSWMCASIPQEVINRRVEITGPVDRKMVINGLNSGANVYMADFEDSTSPTWTNLIDGQVNLRDAVSNQISFTDSKTAKYYTLNEHTAVLFVRPRGWHLDEAHVLVNGRVASASIFDFALYLFHNHAALLKKTSRPYFYLPKMESHLEARLWNDVFVAAQQYLGLPIGTIRATALLETITAAFEMEEILYELRDHSLGLNCGRWDYLFSYIKKFKNHADKITPDRSHLTMTIPLMDSYVKRLIYTCHKHGTFAMGGMSAVLPIKDDIEANAEAMARVVKDKEREAVAGHDGTWVAHPALVSVAKSIFDKFMPGPNQIGSAICSDGLNISEIDLLRLPTVPPGQAITSLGLRKGISIILCYTEAWLRGIGCIPLNNHMEDAATAEISRAQIWQWRHHGVVTEDDDLEVDSDRIRALVDVLVQDQLSVMSGEDKGKWALAGKLVTDMLNRQILDDFLTTICYPHILTTVDLTVSKPIRVNRHSKL